MSVPDAEKRVDQVVAEAKILEFALRESLRGAIVNAIRKIGVSEVIYYRWRQEFGGLKTRVARAIIFPIVARPERRDSAPSTLPHDARRVFSQPKGGRMSPVELSLACRKIAFFLLNASKPSRAW